MAKASTSRKPKTRAAPRRAAHDTLWEVVERVRKKSRGKLEPAIRAFEAELRALDDTTLLRAEAAFADAMARADTWDLWGAAFLIHGVISDDMFWDVRAGLVALGREVFDAALKDPDSLASVRCLVERTLFEGFQYVPPHVVEERGLTSTYARANRTRRGTKWDLDALRAGDTAALARRFPRLAKRFG